VLVGRVRITIDGMDSSLAMWLAPECISHGFVCSVRSWKLEHVDGKSISVRSWHGRDVIHHSAPGIFYQVICPG